MARILNHDLLSVTWFDLITGHVHCSWEYIHYWKKTKCKEMLASQTQNGKKIHEYNSLSKGFLIPWQMIEELIVWPYLLPLAAVVTMSKMNYWGRLLKWWWFVIQLWNYWSFGKLKGMIFTKWIHPFLIPPFSRIKVFKSKHQRKIPSII